MSYLQCISDMLADVVLPCFLAFSKCDLLQADQWALLTFVSLTAVSIRPPSNPPLTLGVPVLCRFDLLGAPIQPADGYVLPV